MKHTKENIFELAKKVLKDFKGNRYKESDIESIFFSKEKELYRGKNEGKMHPCWTIEVKAPFENTDFLTISDETGSPLYYQNFNMIIFEINIDENGFYSKKE